MKYLNQHLHVQSQYIFLKVKNEDTKSDANSWCLYYKLGTDFAHFSDVSIVDFEQVNAS